MSKRIVTGHYDRFDEIGLPVRPSKYHSHEIHNYSTLFAFALGHWDFYLETGRESHLAKVIDVCDYAIKTAHVSADGAVLLRAEGETEHSGPPSALYQGEAMSVLCRAWQATGNRRYLEIALGCLEPFKLPIEAGGVLGRISSIVAPWYEEYPTLPLNHVLNGMAYSLFGLWDLTMTGQDPRARELFDVGINSLVRALPLFDLGYWSLYWVSENGKNYTASMGYHNLHICQLTALYHQTRREDLHQFAVLFTEYARRPLCRIRSAISIACSKLLH
jgi:hypothetical protein